MISYIRNQSQPADIRSDKAPFVLACQAAGQGAKNQIKKLLAFVSSISICFCGYIPHLSPGTRHGSVNGLLNSPPKTTEWIAFHTLQNL